MVAYPVGLLSYSMQLPTENKLIFFLRLGFSYLPFSSNRKLNLCMVRNLTVASLLSHIHDHTHLSGLEDSRMAQHSVKCYEEASLFFLETMYHRKRHELLLPGFYLKLL